MILVLAMPYVDRAVDACRVTNWYKAEGERVEYGEDLCDLNVQEVAWVNHEQSAVGLISARDQSGAARLTRARRQAAFRIRLVASDVGYLRRIEAVPPTEVRPGERLALLTTDPLEPLPADAPEEDSALFRVVHDSAGEDE